MTLERLSEILDAYGADPERWPAEERPQALALLTRSAAARAHLDAAARLDHVLDGLPTTPPPAVTLHARVVAAAPARRHRHRWLAVPVAVAAALALWVLRPAETSLTPAPTVPMAQLGVYETPTDSLLSVDDLAAPPGVPAADPPDVPRFLPNTDPILTTNSKRMHA